MKATGNMPLIVHQNGDKIYSSIVEEIAKELDVPYSQSRIDEVEENLDRQRREQEEREAAKKTPEKE
jgi:hypothetical protein